MVDFLSVMKKTSLYIDPDVDRALARTAAAAGITKAELVRQELRKAVGHAIKPRPSARGVFEGPHDLATNIDRELAETGFGEQ